MVYHGKSQKFVVEPVNFVDGDSRNKLLYTVSIVNVWNDRKKRSLGMIDLAEREGTLKSPIKIAREIAKLEFQATAKEAGKACRIHSPEEYRCESFKLIDKTGGRILVDKTGGFVVNGKAVSMNGETVRITESTEWLRFEGEGRYVNVTLKNKGSSQKDLYHIDTDRLVDHRLELKPGHK